MFERSPPRFDERIRVRDVGLRENPLEKSGIHQFVDCAVVVLDTAVNKESWFGVFAFARGLEQEVCCYAWIERCGYLPRQNAAREVVDDSMKVGTRAVEQPNQRRIDMPYLVCLGSSNSDLRLRGVYT